MKLLVLINATAGSVSAKDCAGKVTAAFERHGVVPTIQLLQGADIAAAARDFAKARSTSRGQAETTLVVGGGDGSISAAAGVLAGTDLPLGILPLGTLNHFAKDLGLPLDVDQAADIIVAGRTRTIDVAEANGRVFINNSSVGLYPFMVARRNAHQRKSGMSKLLSTFPAMGETFRRATWHRLEIAAMGHHHPVRTPCIFVGNNRYEVGLATFGTRLRLDCGELDIHVIRQQNRLGILLLPFKIALGLVDRERDVQVLRSTELEIVTRRRRSLRVSLDGEVVRMTMPLCYRSRPAALRVFCGAPKPRG